MLRGSQDPAAVSSSALQSNVSCPTMPRINIHRNIVRPNELQERATDSVSHSDSPVVDEVVTWDKIATTKINPGQQTYVSVKGETPAHNLPAVVSSLSLAPTSESSRPGKDASCMYSTVAATPFHYVSDSVHGNESKVKGVITPLSQSEHSHYSMQDNKTIDETEIMNAPLMEVFDGFRLDIGMHGGVGLFKDSCIPEAEGNELFQPSLVADVDNEINDFLHGLIGDIDIVEASPSKKMKVTLSNKLP